LILRLFRIVPAESLDLPTIRPFPNTMPAFATPRPKSGRFAASLNNFALATTPLFTII
jgi:hypothetical protein